MRFSYLLSVVVSFFFFFLQIKCVLSFDFIGGKSKPFFKHTVKGDAKSMHSTKTIFFFSRYPIKSKGAFVHS